MFADLSVCLSDPFLRKALSVKTVEVIQPKLLIIVGSIYVELSYRSLYNIATKLVYSIVLRSANQGKFIRKRRLE